MRPVTRALLLDFDDTLIDTKAATVAAGTVAVAELWPEAGAEVHHAAGFHFQRDPSGFFGRFTVGELGFVPMMEARVADLLEMFTLKAINDVNLRFQNAYAGPSRRMCACSTMSCPSWRLPPRRGSRWVCSPARRRTTRNRSSRSPVLRVSSPSWRPETPWDSGKQTPG